MEAPAPAGFTYGEYRDVLRSASEGGYTFEAFSSADSWDGKRRICLLRHDCDNDLLAAARMARLEMRLGVRSTYFLMLRSPIYNLLSIPSVELVRRIIECEHRVGLHFDECRYPNATAEDIAAQVDRERAIVSEEFGVPVDVVSFHQPSERVLAQKVRLSCLNAYDRSQMRQMYYLSDSNAQWRKQDPIQAFRDGRHPGIQLLIHPEWWTVHPATTREKWKGVLARQFGQMQRTLLAREDTYLDPLKIRLLHDRRAESEGRQTPEEEAE